MAFRFEDLEIWKEAIEYSNVIYSITKKFPKDELFSLTNQLHRSANSISANIAEGSGSSSDKDFSNYLSISIKSLYETVSHLFIARKQNYISDEDFRMLYQSAENLSKRIRAFKFTLTK